MYKGIAGIAAELEGWQIKEAIGFVPKELNNLNAAHLSVRFPNHLACASGLAIWRRAYGRLLAAKESTSCHWLSFSPRGHGGDASSRAGSLSGALRLGSRNSGPGQAQGLTHFRFNSGGYVLVVF